MLTAIRFDGHTLHLRKPHSENIFDIDSLSLLIGPNGSGKTRFLETLIEEFVPSQMLSLTKGWQAEFDFETHEGRGSFENWGVVYYNPVPYRPILTARKGFIDASGKTNGNIFELVSHADILQGFDLKIKLLATLNANFDALCSILADSFLEEGGAEHPHLQPLINYIKHCEQQLSPARTFKIKDEITRLSKELKTAKENFYAAFKQETLAHSFSTLPTLRAYAIFAVLNHLIDARTLTPKKAVDFLSRHLELNYYLFRSSTITPEEQEKHFTLIDNTVALMEHLSIRPDQINGRVLDAVRHVLDLEHDISLFERQFHPHAFSIDLPGLSSGEHAICNQLIALKNAIRCLSKYQNILVLIDEGDAFLHLAWQRCYILELNNFLARCKAEVGIENLQLVIASHSPLLTSDVPSEFVCRLDATSGSHAQLSFAAPIHSILNLSFDSSTIGEFATRRINATIEKLEHNQPLTPLDDYVIASVDDPIISRELKRLQAERAS